MLPANPKQTEKETGDSYRDYIAYRGAGFNPEERKEGQEGRGKKDY